MAGRVRDVEIDIVPALEPSSGDLDTVIARLSSPSLSTLRHIHSAVGFPTPSHLGLLYFLQVHGPDSTRPRSGGENADGQLSPGHSQTTARVPG